MNTKPTVSRVVDRAKITEQPNTRAKADEEGDSYEYSRISPAHYACTHGKNTHIIIDKDGKIGCSCGDMTYRCTGTSACKHIIKFLDLKVPPQIPAPGELIKKLMLMGWVGGKDDLHPAELLRRPQSSSGEPEPYEEPDLVVDHVVPEMPSPPNDDHSTILSETVHYECPNCGEIVDIDGDKFADWILKHLGVCTGAKANTLETPESSEQVVTSRTANIPDGSKLVATENHATIKPPTEKGKVNQQPNNTGSLFDWVENLIEFGVGQIFGDTGTAKTALCREVAEQAADEGKKVVYWDTEGNMTRAQREAMTGRKNIVYILDRDWAHIKNMLSSDLSKGSPKLGKCDLFILDSIGVPVLGIYGTLKQNEKGNALQAMQGLLYELTKFAEENDAVVIVTNHPVSEMNKSEAEKADRHPFGDKAMFFTKEILKIVPRERTEYKTVCHVLAWRSRSAGRGKMLCTVTVSDNGVEVTPT